MGRSHVIGGHLSIVKDYHNLMRHVLIEEAKSAI